MFRTYFDKKEFDCDIEHIRWNFSRSGLNLSYDEAVIHFWLCVPLLERLTFHGKRAGILAGCRCPRCCNASLAGVCNPE